jgi:hypothetical protein
MSFIPFVKWESEVSRLDDKETGLINYGRDAAQK